MDKGQESLEVVVAMAVAAPVVAVAAPFIAVVLTIAHLLCGGYRNG